MNDQYVPKHRAPVEEPLARVLSFDAAVRARVASAERRFSADERVVERVVGDEVVTVQGPTTAADAVPEAVWTVQVPVVQSASACATEPERVVRWWVVVMAVALVLAAATGASGVVWVLLN